jgi:hypothetical protein
METTTPPLPPGATWSDDWQDAGADQYRVIAVDRGIEQHRARGHDPMNLTFGRGLPSASAAPTLGIALWASVVS